MTVELTAEMIQGFSGGLLSKRYNDPAPSPSFHKTLWEYCCDPAQRVAIAAPRGHAKSTAVTHAYVLANLLFRATDFIVIISDTETQAKRFLQDIKMELRENDELIDLFGVQKTKWEKDSETEIQLELGEDQHPVCIMVRGCAGGAGSVRGFKWRGKRPGLIVCDDVENDEAVLNEERRAKMREWCYNALLPSLARSGKIRVVGTVLHFDSLLERWMPQSTGEKAQYFRKEGLVEWSEGDPMEDFKSIKFRAHTDFDDFSEILWPEMYDAEFLKRVRNGYILQGAPEGYAQEYLNYPIAAATAYFRKDDFLTMEEEDHKLPKTYYAAIDLAISDKDKRSYTVIVVGGLDPSGMLHIEKVVRRRMDSNEIVDEMMDVQIRYNPDLFVIEDGALAKSIGPYLKSEMLRTGTFINLHPKTPTTDKRSRATSIRGRMRQGGVKFDKESEWYPSLEQEMLRFDRGEYDDQVDAMAWLGLVLNEMVESPTQEEIDEMDWEEEVALYMTAASQGRSSITGY